MGLGTECSYGVDKDRSRFISNLESCFSKLVKRKDRKSFCCSLKVKSLSRVRLCDPMDCNQAPPSMGFSRQECWSGLPFPSPGYLPDPGIEPGSPTLQADALPSEPPGKSN